MAKRTALLPKGAKSPETTTVTEATQPANDGAERHRLEMHIASAKDSLKRILANVEESMFGVKEWTLLTEEPSSLRNFSDERIDNLQQSLRLRFTEDFMHIFEHLRLVQGDVADIEADLVKRGVL